MGPTSTRSALADALARAFLAARWEERDLVTRGREALEPPPRWLRALVRDLLELYAVKPADRPRELAAVVERLLDRQRFRRLPVVRKRFLSEPEMAPSAWPVPEIATLGDLAAFLDLHVGELEWLADRRGLERSVDSEQLRNYAYTWVPRRAGPPRVLERPKRLLKELQRRILHQILDVVPPHTEAQGFRRGHSVLTHARRHVGNRVVLRFDLEDFFASVHAGRVYGVFRTAGYPESVAHALTAFCTNVVPRDEWARVPAPADPRVTPAYHRLGRRLATPHLPLGAPTSPALANLRAFGLDRRLSALATSMGAAYSRYADDIALSGDAWLLEHAPGVRATIATVVQEEGFRLNERK